MHPLKNIWWRFLIAGMLLAACAPPPAASLSVEPAVLVTLDPNATPTPTPFQPAYQMSTEAASTLEPSPSAALPSPEVPTPTATLTATLPPELNPALTPSPLAVQDDRELVTFLLLGSDTRGGTSF